MIKKEINYGLRIKDEQTLNIFNSIAECVAHTSVSPTTLRAILEGRQESYKNRTFKCIVRDGNITKVKYRTVGKYDHITEDNRPEDEAFIAERERIYFSPFVCCETGERFESILDGHDKTGIRIGILVNCLRDGSAYNGLTFKYIR